MLGSETKYFKKQMSLYSHGAYSLFRKLYINHWILSYNFLLNNTVKVFKFVSRAHKYLIYQISLTFDFEYLECNFLK